MGDGYVLHSHISGAIVLSNALGLSIYDHLLSGKGLDQIAIQVAHDLGISEDQAVSITSQVMEAWESAGLLDKKKSAFPDPATWQSPQKPYDEFALSFGNTAITIQCQDRLLTQQLNIILKNYLHHTETTSVTTITIVPQKSGGFGVFKEGAPLWGRCDRDLARNLVLREIAALLCGRNETAAILHAGGIANARGDALIIAGMSGSGKSTLTAGLVAEGLHYLADDLLPLHTDGKSVMAFPVALGLKPGAWHLPEAQFLGCETAAPATMPRDGVNYRHVPTSRLMGQRSPVAAIIFPEFNPQSEERLQRISPETALQQLIKAGARLTREVNSIIPVTQLLNRVPAYVLHYASSTCSVKTCLNLLTDRPC